MADSGKVRRPAIVIRSLEARRVTQRETLSKQRQQQQLNKLAANGIRVPNRRSS